MFLLKDCFLSLFIKDSLHLGVSFGWLTPHHFSINECSADRWQVLDCLLFAYDHSRGMGSERPIKGRVGAGVSMEYACLENVSKLSNQNRPIH